MLAGSTAKPGSYMLRHGGRGDELGSGGAGASELSEGELGEGGAGAGASEGSGRGGGRSH